MADHNKPIPWQIAFEKASEIVEQLKSCCERIQIAGSLRRLRPTVNDIEILCIPKLELQNKEGCLLQEEENLLELKLISLLDNGILSQRLKKDGTKTFGRTIKLLHIEPCKIALDIFSTTHEGWFNNLVSRTGGKQTNITIASSAKRRGLQWLPFGNGFLNGEVLVNISSEDEVFTMVGLPYPVPRDRP